MTPITRRAFLKTSAAAAAGVTLSARSWAQVAGANGDLRVAVIGLNGRGKSHVSSLKALSGVRLAALCDVDSAVLDKARERVGGPVKAYRDIRDLLGSPDIDAVTIATPNHWHALAAIWACQAGKDVYVEKPVCHEVWEGRQLVAAAAKYGRIVQAGMQIRSGEGLREAVEWVRAGNLGPVRIARGFCYKRRDSIGKVARTPPPPPTVDLDLWCGPAPLAAPHRARFHYDWHWQWPTGNGDIGNQGVHQIDVARWFLGEAGLPRRSLSVGGRLGYVDDGQTPNTQLIFHDYPQAPLLFEVRGLPSRSGSESMDRYRGVSIGNIIDCEGGSVVIADYWTAKAYDRSGALIRKFRGVDRHMENFVDAVRSRRAAGLYAPVQEGYTSSALCHLGNISHRLGRIAEPGAIGEAIKADAALAEAHGRMVEHLRGNGVDLEATPATLGWPLSFDPSAGRFAGAGAAEANALLTRAYRAPFVVPSVT